MRTSRSLGARPLALLVLSAGVLCSGWLPGNRLAEANRKGIQAYDKKDYDTALRQYTAAQGFAEPDDPRLLYNIGSVLAQQKKGEEAIKSFERAGRTASGPLASRAFHNQGNVFYGMEKWKEAVTAYQEALLRNPADKETKRNLELALRKLEQEQQQKQKEQQEQGKQGDRQERPKEEEKTPQQGDQAPKPEEKPEKKPEPQAGQQKPQDPQKEEMDRLLQMVQEEEKKALREERKEAEASSARPTRDW